jgi:carbon-monoxide dehydrogenase small subunit
MRRWNKTDHAELELRVNGQTHRATVSPRLLLSDLLREKLGLTGTHVGCEHGVCGACTVLVDGLSVRSCLTLAVQCAERDVVTVEGLADGDGLSSLQQCFNDHHALQCGYCTPGFLIAAHEFVGSLPPGDDVSADAVRRALSGNLCRCTGYENIVRAVVAAAENRGAIQHG